MKMCKGIPLAILSLGGFIGTKQTAKEWELVRTRINNLYARTADVTELERSIKSVLYSSYHDLPYKLKSCFLCLANFKEDEYIREGELFQLWIGEGMVASRFGEESLMEVGKGYLHELTQRNMVQQRIDNGISSSEIYVTVHDVVRDMCLSMARYDNFLRFVDHQLSLSNPVVVSTGNNAPWNRLSINIDTAENCDLDAVNNCLKEAMEISNNLRSLNAHADFSFKMQIRLDIKSWNFKLLRVLRLQNVKVGELPKAIGDFIHLRTLRLESCEIRKLPLAIGKLRSLQVLELGTFFDIESFEGSLDMLQPLKRLVYLRLDLYDESKRKLRLSSLTNLERFEAGSSEIYQVEDLLCLKRLRWFDSGNVKKVGDLRGIAEYLQNNSSDQLEYAKLKIVSCDLSSGSTLGGLLKQLIFQCQKLTALDLQECKIDVLPAYNLTEDNDMKNFVSLLRVLSLSYLKFKEDPTRILEKYFPKLEKLVLESVSLGGEELVLSADGFPNLKSLALWSCEGLKRIMVEEGAMRTLRTLEIWGCKNLEMIPEGLRHITSLQTLLINNMSPEFEKRLKVIDGEEGQDFYKVRHVPTITFGGYYTDDE